MAEENSSEFRFEADDQETESFYQEELKDLRVEKLSQRLTLLTILLPCLLAVAAYFGYRDITGRINQSLAQGHDTASLEIKRLSRELEDLDRNFNEKLITFSTTLSTQDRDFGTSIESRLIATDKNIELLQKKIKSSNVELKQDLKLIQDTIEKLKASKVDKKSQAVAIEKINAAINPLEKEVQQLKSLEQEFKAVSDSLATLESRLTNQLDTLNVDTRQQGKNYEQIQESVTKLSNDKDRLALEVLMLKKSLQNQIAKEISDLNQRLDTIQSEVIDFEKISGTQKQSLKRLSKDADSQQSDAASTTRTDSATVSAPPGTITEKDLIE